MAHWIRVLVAMLTVFAAGAGTARAQLEEIEPRTVGGRGATFVGMSGFVDRFSSPEEALPLNYTAQVDVCRFITNKFAIRFGAVGSGSLGGDHEDELLSGSGAPALHIPPFCAPLKAAKVRNVYGLKVLFGTACDEVGTTRA